VLMLQKEVAQRMAANPGSKQYGSFSVFVQFHAEVELFSLVSKSSFIPWPEVSSAIVVLSPHKTPRYKVKDEKLFFDIVHKAFQQRRKKLRNSLKDFKLENAGVDLNKRPEQLSIEDFAALSNFF
ncbi:MAG: rRNA adenine dimethyltransferase family protein, partial [Candidatus Margulisiibacteriota bacterium]